MKSKIALTLILLLLVETASCKSINISVVQMYAHQQTFEQFKADISKYVIQAKNMKSDVLVFPEDAMVNLIFNKPWNKKSLIDLSKFYDNYKNYISDLAKKNNIVIIGGTNTRIVDNKIYNTILAGLPRREVIEHDKIYLTPSEKKVGYLVRVIKY